MYEYSSVSASSYDPAALVAKLNQSTAEGWDVVSIVPTGGDVSAFLRRSLPAADEVLVAEVVVVDETGESWAPEAGSPVTDWATSDGGDDTILVAEGVDEAVEGVDTTEEPEAVTDDAPGPVETVETVEAVEVVEEPAGWAVAPETTDAPVVEDAPAPETTLVEEVAAETDAEQVEPAPVAEATPAVVDAPVAEPSPAPAPAPQPAPVVTTPAGWYPDPSTRYELRYWDGTQWTEHVARQGQQFTDPPIP